MKMKIIKFSLIIHILQKNKFVATEFKNSHVDLIIKLNVQASPAEQDPMQKSLLAITWFVRPKDERDGTFGTIISANANGNNNYQRMMTSTTILEPLQRAGLKAKSFQMQTQERQVNMMAEPYVCMSSSHIGVSYTYTVFLNSNCTREKEYIKVIRIIQKQYRIPDVKLFFIFQK